MYFDYISLSINRVKAAVIGNTFTFTSQIFFIYYGFSVEYIALAVFLGSVVNGSVLLVLLSKAPLNFDAVINWKLINNIFTNSIPFTLAAAAHMIYMRTDLLMVEYFMSYEHVAVYSVSMQLTALATILVYPLQVACFPRLIKIRNKNITNYFNEYSSLTNLFTFIGIIIGILGIVLIAPFLGIFFNDKYAVINEYFIIQMASVGIIYNSALRSSHITFIKKAHILLIIQLISLLMNILLNILFIPTYGLKGAAFATFITVICSLLLSSYFFAGIRVLFWIQVRSFLSVPRIESIKLLLMRDKI